MSNVKSSTPKKKGLISSLYNSKNPESARLTETDLINKYKRGQPISQEDVLQLNRSTETFLCDQADNVYEIDFVKFKLRDLDTAAVLFEVAKPDNVKTDFTVENNAARFIRYNFAAEFLKLKTIGAT